MKEKAPDKKEMLRRYVDDLYTRRDAEDFFRTIRTDSMMAAFVDEMDRSWPDTGKEPATPEKYRLYKEEAGILLQRIHRKERKKKQLFYFRSAAAALLAFFTVGTVYFLSGERPGPEPRLSMIEVTVDHGSHKQLSLPDGTQVILNAGSVIRYPGEFAGKKRELELNGEGFFDVAKDEHKPFVIHTSHADVTVLGTSFNLKSYDADEQFFLCVESGKVKVDMPDLMVQLLPDEQFIWDKTDGNMQKRTENVELVKSWIRGGLYFNRTPVRSVVKELERMYDCTIRFTPGPAYNEYIYGQHENKSLESVLNAIRYTTDIRYRQDDTGYILYKEE